MPPRDRHDRTVSSTLSRCASGAEVPGCHGRKIARRLLPGRFATCQPRIECIEPC